jgi:hypothetical protein
MHSSLAESRRIQYDWIYDWTVGRPPNPHSHAAHSPSRPSAGHRRSSGRKRNCEACDARALEEKACSKIKAERAAKRHAEAMRKAERDALAPMKPLMRRAETMPELRGRAASAGSLQAWKEGKDKVVRGQGHGTRIARMSLPEGERLAEEVDEY